MFERAETSKSPFTLEHCVSYMVLQFHLWYDQYSPFTYDMSYRQPNKDDTLSIKQADKI
jgi:hypothetical protein